MARDNGILLESGTNELELLELVADGQSFGINVAKVREIVTYEEERVVAIPSAPPSIRGMYNYRGGTFNLIDLNLELNRDIENRERPIVVITQFNTVTTGFLVDSVQAIHRFSWKDISPMSSIFSEDATSFTGSVRINKGEDLMLLLDLENILARLMPETAIVLEDEPDQEKQIITREQKKVLVAEDSQMIRNMILKALHKEGYEATFAFENGELAWQQLEKWAAGNIDDHIDLVVTDIEMPQMDGLTLCKMIKSDQRMGHLPVVFFSSMINDQMAQKCKSVGGDGHMTKPQINNLVHLLDELLHVD